MRADRSGTGRHQGVRKRGRVRSYIGRSVVEPGDDLLQCAAVLEGRVSLSPRAGNRPEICARAFQHRQSLRRARRYDRASRHYLEAVRLHPAYADAHYNLALLFQGSGQVMEAVRHWKTYLKLDPQQFLGGDCTPGIGQASTLYGLSGKRAVGSNGRCSNSSVVGPGGFANRPPSTHIVCPVTKSAESLARKATMRATSTGSPTRPNGVSFAHVPA